MNGKREKMVCFTRGNQFILLEFLLLLSYSSNILICVKVIPKVGIEAFSAVAPSSGLRIVGGLNATIEDYPYQISIQFSGRHGCGGSIINSKFILTAAHCIFDVTAEQVSIRAGSSYRNEGGEVYNVLKIHKHALFNEDTFDYDIALLELQTELNFGTGVRPIPLASSGTMISDGMIAKATGWGRLSDGGQPAKQLQVVTLPAITTETCQNYYGPEYLTKRMFCAGYDAGGKDTCEGDSGGPLVISGIQIGLTSWGLVCAEAGKPGVYTKLTLFQNFIDSIIN